MKIRVTYIDWLIMTRGSMSPKIGDIIIHNNCHETVVEEYDGKPWLRVKGFENTRNLFIDLCSMELEMPPIQWFEQSDGTVLGNYLKITVFKCKPHYKKYALFDSDKLLMKGDLKACKNFAIKNFNIIQNE